MNIINDINDINNINNILYQYFILCGFQQVCKFLFNFLILLIYYSFKLKSKYIFCLIYFYVFDFGKMINPCSYAHLNAIWAVVLLYFFPN